LTGHIGTASAKILISSVIKEDKISLPEVLRILEESQENIIINKKLTETSKELKYQVKNANQKLIKRHSKDEFLDTVTHELRTNYRDPCSNRNLHDDEDDVPKKSENSF
jgi:hypothetical protein